MSPHPIQFQRAICADLQQATSREWLEANGLGGFASSTITGLNTRRYHGLLCAATKPPVGRLLLLSKLEETFIVDGRRFDLSVNQYPGAVHPQGHHYLCEFRLDPFPIFTYQVEGLEIEKRVFMVHGENTTVIEYELRALDREDLPSCRLELRPLIAFRDYHSTTHRNDAINQGFDNAPGVIGLTPYAGLPSLFLAHNAADVGSTGHWYNNFEYAMERERGLDFQEDLFNPVVLRYEFGLCAQATVIAATGPRDAGSAPQLRRDELARRAAVLAAAPSPEPIVQRLVAAADAYIVQRGSLRTVIAGYPWFSDWGRDTMIALPGLTLHTGRPEVARQILQAFAESVDQGILPNRFPDAGETPEYNTADATLWFFEAIRAYLASTGDYTFVRDHLFSTLRDIVNAHLRGTRYGIRVEGDGLLHCGEPGVQLTWMDAKIGDWVVTPRTGKPVEIQALWYNALSVMQDLSHRFGDLGAEVFLRSLAQHARISFNERFWNDEAGCLYDVIDAGGHDASIRPNQIFAASLHHSMLSASRAAQVVRTVHRDLFTPLGLRSLSPRDPAYRPRYEGGVYERDSAYHQGTVWPWLLGPFITAYVRVNGSTSQAKAEAASWLDTIGAHFTQACLGQISEIADADSPHVPRGCPAQAWSVAEILRAAIQDVYSTPAIVTEHQGADDAGLEVDPIPGIFSAANNLHNDGGR
ncbi:amylo-alpha-1,6-glucosidase [uncultured Paludibaculum sp.]|uniref:amylo-alpha-1,6-glucosidase n=1 Tax=uncultured Paludibaculum sp. TaxID=1765020 RepID=UPI002AAB094F|nr:amylo-alpha-1,6-glucosidase [uncultured Paludibaculum sp.]